MTQNLTRIDRAVEGVALELKNLCDTVFRLQQAEGEVSTLRQQGVVKYGVVNPLFVIEVKRLIITAQMPKDYCFDAADPRPTRSRNPGESLEGDQPRVEIEDLIAAGSAVLAWVSIGILMIEQEFGTWIKDNTLNWPDWRKSEDWLRCRAVSSYGRIIEHLPPPAIQ